MSKTRLDGLDTSGRLTKSALWRSRSYRNFRASGLSDCARCIQRKDARIGLGAVVLGSDTLRFGFSLEKRNKQDSFRLTTRHPGVSQTHPLPLFAVWLATNAVSACGTKSREQREKPYPVGQLEIQSPVYENTNGAWQVLSRLRVRCQQVFRRDATHKQVSVRQTAQSFRGRLATGSLALLLLYSDVSTLIATRQGARIPWIARSCRYVYPRRGRGVGLTIQSDS